jgi:hypothetical protein
MKIQRALIVLSLIGGICFPVLSSSQPNDLKGWNKAIWGMTEEEIQTAFKGQVQRKAKPFKSQKEGYYINLEIPDIQIGKAKLTVGFCMDDKTNLLKRVSLIANNPSEPLFRSLERDLVAKYGQMTYKDRDYIPTDALNKMRRVGIGLESMNRLWRFPSTTIRLLYFVGALGGKQADSVSIGYLQNTGSDNL